MKRITAALSVGIAALALGTHAFAGNRLDLRLGGLVAGLRLGPQSRRPLVALSRIQVRHADGLIGDKSPLRLSTGVGLGRWFQLVRDPSNPVWP